MSQICFPNHVGLPGQPDPPTIDGFIEPEDFIESGFGTTASEVDTGWTGSSRITYVADVSVGAGRPLMALQGVKHRTSDFLFLSFIVRRDTAFDEQDRIVLVLHPNFATGSAAKTGDERRIDIFPNSGGIGAGAPGGPVGPDDLREDRPPRNVEYTRWNTATGQWDSMATPTGADIKVRSWNLGVNNRNWSVEVRLPTSVAAGGANWINLGPSIGFYANVIRVCSGGECSFDPTPFDGGSFQFTWPRADYLTGDRLIVGEADVSLATIPPGWLGEAFIGNVAGCTGVNGVKFQSGASSIGVLAGVAITNAIDANAPNHFVARLVNTATTAAQDVEATFRIANWGIGPGDNNKWNLVPATGGTTNPSTPLNVPAGGAPVDLTMQWTLTAAERALYGGTLSAHQCIWVLLDSVQNVDFAESSVRRNLNFVGLSEHRQEAEISGVGYPAPGGETDHEFVLLRSQLRRAILVRNEPNNPPPQTGPGDSKWTPGQSLPEPKGREELERLRAELARRGLEVEYRWLWVLDGYRQTEFTYAAGTRRYRIYQPAGSFGYIGQHQGLVAAWESSVQPVGPSEQHFRADPAAGAYSLRVPHDGAARILTVLKATEYPPPTEPPGTSQGCNLIAVLLHALRRLFRGA